jgi:hypothetical protein
MESKFETERRQDTQNEIDVLVNNTSEILTVSLKIIPVLNLLREMSSILYLKPKSHQFVN